MKFSSPAVRRFALVLAAAGSTAPAVLAADTGSAELDEILVTAEKTSAPLSTIPISISAVSRETLEKEHITDYESLSRSVPNLSFSSFGGPGQSNIEIRGVSSQAGSATTGIYLDEVPINIMNMYTAGATEPRFFDIDRVEVLRGPQGTIYGSSSMGGTIHFVSNAPDLEKFSGNVHTSAGATHGGAFNGEADSVVNVPLVDGKAALRVGALFDHESGWIDRNAAGVVVDTKINSVDTSVIRATLEWRPTDQLSITPSVFLQRVTVGGQDLFSLSLPYYQSPTLIPETARDEYAVTSLTLKYDMGWSDLTSVTGYFYRRDDRNIDGTFYDSEYLGFILDETYGYGGSSIAALAAPVQFNTNVNQIHEELRISSKPDGGSQWSWIGGLYYSRTRTGLLDNEYIPGFNSTFESVYNDTPQSLLGAAFPNDLVYYAFTEFVNSQKAVFGQVNYKPIPHLKITAGARYEKSTEDLSFNSAGFFSSGEPYSGSAEGSKVTPRFSIAYELDRTLLYASAAEGFRDGGINRPVPVPLCSADLAGLGFSGSPPSYKQDSLWSYELGAKSRTAGGALNLSGALFDIRWDNIQTDVLLPTCTFDIKTNIGSAESRGVELELNAKLNENLRLNFGGSYTSAKITEPVSVLGVERGDRVPGVPSYSISTSLDYSQPVLRDALATYNLNAQWVGPSQGTILHGDPDFDRPAYLVMGANAGVKWNRLNLSLFVTNLLNQDKIIQRPNIAAVEYGMTVRPRTIGLGANYAF
jgi:outer membrane receptor protein involved in Fe transport